MKKLNFSNYKIKKTKNKSKILSWQEYALEVIKTFNIKYPYTQIIFKQAKKNISFLRGKVENTKEKFGTKKLENKGRYLISLFRKKKPWVK